MFQRIYVEKKIRKHPRVLEIISKLPNLPLVEIENYGEIFFRKGQDFLLQKKFPSLVLSKKEGERVQKMPDFCPAPLKEKYYFSHVLGCLMDCEYCFLRGALPSANVVVFINYEDFFQDLPAGKAFVSTAFENDSLSMENLLGFVKVAVDYANKFPEKTIELRTKMANADSLPESPPSNLILSFSMSDESAWKKHEAGTASPERRLLCAAKMKQRGWKIAFHFDPLFDDSLPMRTIKKFHNLLADESQDFVSTNCYREKKFRGQKEKVFLGVRGAPLSYFTVGRLRMSSDFRKKARRISSLNLSLKF